MSMPNVTADLHARASRVRLACFDVDGTLTDGRLFYDADGRESKAFNIHDGQGLVLLRRVGIEVALVTARDSAAAGHRGRDLGLRTHVGCGDKLACVQGIADELGIGLDAVSFMGDDLPDRTVMQAVGLAVAPSDAHAWARAVAHWITPSRGGDGAARELCDTILAVQGHLGGLVGGAP